MRWGGGGGLLLLFAGVHLCVSKCTTLCARAPAVEFRGCGEAAQASAQETRFDTGMAKITCVQTVIASQTIRTAITHFLKVNVLKQGGAASPANNLTKDPQGRYSGGREAR